MMMIMNITCDGKDYKGVSTRAFQSFQDDEGACSCLPKKRCCTPDENTQDIPQRKRRRILDKVRFASDVEVHTIEQEMEDIQNRWYCKEDYQRIKQQNHQTIVAVQRANGKVETIDVNQYCIRGLEVQIAYHLLNIPADRQKRVVASVLTMQQVQRNLKQPNPQGLRECSKLVSTHDKRKAWTMAKIDAFQ